MRERELLADALNGLVETETRFDAHHEQVEHVGQSETNPVLPLLRETSEHHARQDVADGASAEREGDVRAEEYRRGEHEEERGGDREADAEEDDERFAAAVAGVHQLLLQL